MARIVCLGEGLLELRRGERNWELGSAGDTLNTAIHLARAGHDVAYMTAVGTDPLSEDLKRGWQAERIDTSLVLTHPTRPPGIYAINTDASGERTFTYWRSTSAAREMFALERAGEAVAEAERADLLYFSLISLAILPPEGRRRLFGLAESVRKRGGTVAFDSNYRPQLWDDTGDARATRDTAIALAGFGFPTLHDEVAFGDGATADAVAAHWAALGCAETVVKLGAAGCRLPDGSVIAPEKVLKPVDTSGAGDAFNAGYMDARLKGGTIEQAARAGQALAGWTIMRSGAIPPRSS